MKKVTFQFQDIDGIVQGEKTLGLQDGDKLIFKCNKKVPNNQIEGYLTSLSRNFDDAKIIYVPEFFDVFVLKVGENQ